jgi:hypothetical protein
MSRYKLKKPDNGTAGKQRRSPAMKDWRWCFLIGALLLAGCAAMGQPQPVPYPALSAEAITTEISVIENKLSKTPGAAPSSKKNAGQLLRLAMLHAHQDNPAPDYHRALDYLTQYAELGETVDVEYALSLLARLSKCVTDGNRACDKLSARNKELEEQCQALTQENRNHKQMLEKLKSLDIRLEKKRRGLD